MKGSSALEFAILGLVRSGVLTGYSVSQVFAGTPLSVFSPSPGSIYPAVKRLLKAGRLEEVPRPGSPVGTQRALRVTQAGEESFAGWLRSPVSQADVERDMETLFLRLAFMSGVLSTEEIGCFVRRLQIELDAQVERLTRYAEETSDLMPVSAALSLAAGLARVRAYAAWARDAARTVEDTRAAPGAGK